MSSGSSSSSDSESDKKHRKKSKKDKKSKKEKKSHSHKLPDGVEPLGKDTDAEYYSKHVEFKLWLFEYRKKHFDTLDRDKATKQFKKFVKSWNKGGLDPKYYNGVHESALVGSARSSHKWKFKVSQTERDQIETIKDSVDTHTWSLTKEQALLNEAAKAKKALAARKRELEKEDNSDGETAKRSKQDFRKHKEWKESSIEQAIGAKPTGRDALIEKRMARRETHQRDGSPDMDADSLMGGSSNHLQRIAMHKREQRAAKAEVASQRIAELQEKERLKMEQFKKQMGLN